MTGAAAETVAVVLLLASLAFAVVRPRGLNEAVVALPAGILVIALGIVPWDDAVDTVHRFGPTVLFLAAILVFGHLCADAGVFTFLGSLAARLSRGQPTRLLMLVVALAALTTATLTLDATVVLLTPVVLATTARLAVPARPFAYACTRLANGGSLLLPVSNLTNLLAFAASGLSFGRFAALMLLPWLAMCVAEWFALRTFFRRDLGATGDEPGDVPPAPRYALVVLAVTVALFVVTSAIDVEPFWAALAGCVALLAVKPKEIKPLRLLREASPGFCLFVLALSIVVVGVTRHGLGTELAKLLPDGTGLLALLGVAAIAAVLANVVNNLPATLALLPIAAAAGPAVVLAVLIGVNVGPNATYPGSLATLLWRRLLPTDLKPRAGEFHLLGLLTVPLFVVLATVALWLGVRTIGA